MPERETGNERFARLDREAQTYLAAMPDAERRALRAAWEAQRPIMELAVGTPPSRFINCWAAARAFAAARGGTDGDVTEVDAERLIDKLLDYDLLADPEDSQRNMVIACDLIRTIRRGGTEEERPTMDQHAAVIEALADANRYEDEPTVGEIEAAAVYIYEEDRAPSYFRKWAALRVHDYPLGKAHYRSKARAILAVARATSIRESEA
jgi:hypothetical protein